MTALILRTSNNNQFHLLDHKEDAAVSTKVDSCKLRWIEPLLSCKDTHYSGLPLQMRLYSTQLSLTVCYHLDLLAYSVSPQKNTNHFPPVTQTNQWYRETILCLIWSIMKLEYWVASIVIFKISNYKIWCIIFDVNQIYTPVLSIHFPSPLSPPKKVEGGCKD